MGVRRVRVRRTLANLALACASLAIALLALELFVRAAIGPVEPVNFTLMQGSIKEPAPFPGVPYVLAANATAHQRFPTDPRGYFGETATIVYRTNSLGLRDREIERPKPRGTFRILGLGDSFTFGTGVHRPDLFLTRLQMELYLSEEGPRFEVINLGVIGYNTAHEVALLEHVGLALEPDLVVICFIPNDAEAGMDWARFFPKPADRSPRSAAPAAKPPGPRSLLLEHLRARVERRRQLRRANQRVRQQFAPQAPGWIEARRALDRARELADLHGFRLALLIFPYMTELDDYPFEDVHAAVRAHAEGLRIPSLDLLPAFRGRDGESLWVHPTNQHPNEEAHAIAAEALHAFLVEEGLLGPFPRPSGKAPD